MSSKQLPPLNCANNSFFSIQNVICKKCSLHFPRNREVGLKSYSLKWLIFTSYSLEFLNLESIRCAIILDMKRYRTVNAYYRELFGEKILKLPIDAGFDCPNRDGAVAHGGCTFCTVSGSGDAIVAPEAPIREQFYKEIDFMHRKWPDVEKYLVYFQNFINTHEKLEVIRERYEQAINEPGVVGINIGTRPDCMPDDVIAYLAELSERMHVTVELGLQTTYEDTSRLINRAHSYELYVETVKRIRKQAPRVEIVSHLINGLPEETRDC